MRVLVKIWIALAVLCALAEKSIAQQQYAVRVFFTDKQNTAHSLSQPQQFLSQRAIERRAKYNIDIDSTDLPLTTQYVDSVVNTSNAVVHLTSKWMNYAVLLMPDTLSLYTISGYDFVTSTQVIAYYPSGLHSNTIKTPIITPPPQNHTYTPAAFDQTYYGKAWQQISQCKGEYLHQNGFMGENILIAVLDVGFIAVNSNSAFDSTNSNNRIIDTWNFVNDTAHVFDYGNHGSLVLSCMAANREGTYIGTAPSALYALYLTDDNNTEQFVETDNWLAAAERADSIGADIINASLGYNTFDNPIHNFTFDMLNGNTTLVARAANIAVEKGILVICSAGNEGNSSWKKILSPADATKALTVGAVDSLGNVGTFSSRGPNATGLLKPNVSTRGVGAAVVTQGGSVFNINGTSFSAPILSGLAACLLQAYPNTPPLDLKKAIEKSATNYTFPNVNIGYGIPDFSKAFQTLNSINEKLKTEVEIFPNPVRDILIVQLSNSLINYLHCTIYNLQGQKVVDYIIDNPVKENSIDVTGLHSGMYFMQLNTQSSTITKKIMVVE